MVGGRDEKSDGSHRVGFRVQCLGLREMEFTQGFRLRFKV